MWTLVAKGGVNKEATGVSLRSMRMGTSVPHCHRREMRVAWAGVVALELERGQKELTHLVTEWMVGSVGGDGSVCSEKEQG